MCLCQISMQAGTLCFNSEYPLGPCCRSEYVSRAHASRNCYPLCQACSEPAGRRLLRRGCRQRVRYPAEQFRSSSGPPSASSKAQALVARALSASSTVPCHACPLVCQSLSRYRKTSSAASSALVTGVHVDSNAGRSRRQRYRERLLRLRKAGTLTLASDQPRREPARAGSQEALTAP